MHDDRNAIPLGTSLDLHVGEGPRREEVSDRGSRIRLGERTARPDLDQRPDSLGRGTPGPLKMSYYTGPNAVGLIPTRLLIATRSAAIADPELQDLVSREIRTIVTRRPDLRPALFAAYREAVPEGRRFIESKVGELDRNLSASIRSSVPPQQGAQSPSGSPQQQRGTAGGQPSPDSSQRQ